jgi:hypothetical protein
MDDEIQKAYAVLRRAGIEPEPWAYNFKIAEIAADLMGNQSLGTESWPFDEDYEVSDLFRETHIPGYIRLAKLLVDEACKQRYGNQDGR